MSPTWICIMSIMGVDVMMLKIYLTLKCIKNICFSEGKHIFLSFWEQAASNVPLSSSWNQPVSVLCLQQSSMKSSKKKKRTSFKRKSSKKGAEVSPALFSVTLAKQSTELSVYISLATWFMSTYEKNNKFSSVWWWKSSANYKRKA